MMRIYRDKASALNFAYAWTPVEFWIQKMDSASSFPANFLAG